MTRRVRLGRVAGVFGIKGWVRVASETRPADNIFRYSPWWLGEDTRGFESRALAWQAQNQGWIAQLTDRDGRPIEDRDQAQRLVGSPISVPREALPPLPEGEYYWVDLIGLSVVNAEGVALGTLREMTSNGAQDVMVVVDGEHERLIPFLVGVFVQRVEMDERRVVCDWQPEW